VLAAAGVEPPTGLPAGIEAVERVLDDRCYRFLINHGDADATVAADGHDLLTGTDHVGEVTLPAGGVRVLRNSAALRDGH
jgi:beta-galactosidase